MRQTTEDPTANGSERARREANKAKVLAALQVRSRTNVELAEIGGMRFGGRIYELRHQDGWDIHTSQRKGGLVVYTLLGRVSDRQPKFWEALV
jgi:hypothetical protein